MKLLTGMAAAAMSAVLLTPTLSQAEVRTADARPTVAAAKPTTTASTTLRA